MRSLVRPPFGRFRQLPQSPRGRTNPKFRDPRADRDTDHDMRMPPYMRDSDNSPLSLTKRQYDALIAFVDLLRREKWVAGRPYSPIARKIESFLERLDRKGE